MITVTCYLIDIIIINDIIAIILYNVYLYFNVIFNVLSTVELPTQPAKFTINPDSDLPSLGLHNCC